VTSHDGTLLPGLIEAHTHLVTDSGVSALDRVAGYSDEQIDEVITRALREQLLAGVTTVRDLGDRRFRVVQRRGRQSATGAIEPTIVASGPPLTSIAGHCHPGWRSLGDRRVVRSPTPAPLAAVATKDGALPRLFAIDTERGEHVGDVPGRLAQQRDQHVAGRDVVMAQLLRFALRYLHDLLRLRRERDVTCRRHDRPHLAPGLFQRDAERPGRHPRAVLTEEAKQQMLATDKARGQAAETPPAPSPRPGALGR
jgi:Amidohydrolase family